jgi:hypothetical protein
MKINEAENEKKKRKQSFKTVTVTILLSAAEFSLLINSKPIVKKWIAFHFIFFKSRELILII